MFDAITYALSKAFTKKAIEEADAGNMKIEDYDSEGNGVVNDSRKLGGNLPSYYASTASVVGKMDKSVYDSNDNGIVDNAEKVNNHTVASDVPANAEFTDTKNLSDLQDTDFNNLADGETIVYDAATQKFKNGAGSGGGVGKDLTGQTVEPEQGTTVTAGDSAEIFNDYRERQFNETTGTVAQGNIASGLYSHAEGRRTTASGNFSHSEGDGTIASGQNAHAEGGNTTASGHTSHAEGYQTTASGNYSHAEGNNTTASGLYSHAEGEHTTAVSHAHAEGLYTSASNTYAHAEGRSATASGSGSHAEGYYTTASQTDAHAEGASTTASGIYSHAEGHSTTASAESSHAEGHESQAQATYSHAEGYQTIASSSVAHAEGRNTTAGGAYSHAEGYQTQVANTGAYAHVGGHGTEEHPIKATMDGQFVHGGSSVARTLVSGETVNEVIFGYSSYMYSDQRTNMDASKGFCGKISGTYSQQLNLEKQAMYLLLTSSYTYSGGAHRGSAAYLVTSGGTDSKSPTLVALGTSGTPPTVTAGSSANTLTIANGGASYRSQYTLIRVV